MPSEIEPLLPILVHIQARLSDDLSLRTLAARSGFSPFHFHRTFRLTVGETLKQYTQRLRLEHAAFRLLVHRDRVLDIALDSGFQSHETFSRAFRRCFGVTPREFRRNKQFAHLEKRATEQVAAEERSDCFELSDTKVVELADMDIAFIRHIGQYETVSGELYSRLAAFSEAMDWGQPVAYLGIGHDAPGITPPDRCRYDAAIVAPRPFSPSNGVAHGRLLGGSFALTRHVGPYSTLTAAYTEIAARVVALPGYDALWLPAIEILRTSRVNTEARLNHTDIHLPLERSKTV